jgi:hypothetical protein
MDQHIVDSKAGGGTRIRTTVNVESALRIAEVRAAFNASGEIVEDHFDGAMTRDQVRSLPAVDWLIDGYVTAVGMSGIYGPPGIGKTLFLLYVEDCVLRGRPVFGERKVQRGASMFYAGEGVEHFGQRWRALERVHLKPDDAEPVQSLYLTSAVDLTDPRDVAAVLKTKRDHERDHDVPVVLVVFDPLAEYMTGDENGEDMDLASRGARAVATIGRCAVLLGHHTNASGERERGSEKPRARAEAWFRMEHAGTDRVALIAQKQRGGPKQAMELTKLPAADSATFLLDREWLADDYAAEVEQRKGAAKDRRQDERQQKANAEADDVALTLVRDNPGITKNAAGDLATGTSVGRERLKQALTRLVNDGRVRVELGPNKSQQHYLVEGE